jgi:hypothetical protein
MMRATADPNYHNDWYHRNKERLKADRQRRGRQDYRRKNSYIVHIKTSIGSCADCGLKCTEENHPVFEFDHRDPETKLFSIANGRKRTIRDLQTEIDKCDLVCANCHRLRTMKSEAWRNRRPDQPIDNNPTLF